MNADDSDQSECVERVKAQQEARKSDPRGHEGRPSRGFGDTRPARELPWLTSPARLIAQTFTPKSYNNGRN